MKIRNIAFGYCYVNGELVVHPKDSKVVLDIFNEYTLGKSLLEISEWLNENKVEYMPNVYGWNKSRIMRILEDERYVGKDNYPKIIDQEIFEKAQAKKSSYRSASSSKENNVKIPVPVRCPKCNGLMNRRIDARRAKKGRWTCLNEECRFIVGINDDELLAKITEILNALITNPSLIKTSLKTLIEPSVERIRLNNEISMGMERQEIDKEEQCRRILQLAGLVYKETDNDLWLDRKLKDIFRNAIPTANFCGEIFRRTVDEIKIYEDGEIGLILENKQEINKGDIEMQELKNNKQQELYEETKQKGVFAYCRVGSPEQWFDAENVEDTNSETISLKGW